jgi:hypothetical protein
LTSGEVGWSREFDDPIPLPNGRQLVTLKDTADYIMKLPKAEQDLEEWQTAIHCLLGAAEGRDFLMHARIGVTRPAPAEKRREKVTGDHMSDEEAEAIWETLKEIAGVVAQAQAFNRANNSILMEVVRDLAKTTPDPHRYISDMFERVSARADQGAIEKEAHQVTAEFRDAISRFFPTAGKNLKKTG